MDSPQCVPTSKFKIEAIASPFSLPAAPPALLTSAVGPSPATPASSPSPASPVAQWDFTPNFFVEASESTNESIGSNHEPIVQGKKRKRNSPIVQGKKRKRITMTDNQGSGSASSSGKRPSVGTKRFNWSREQEKKLITLLHREFVSMKYRGKKISKDSLERIIIQLNSTVRSGPSLTIDKLRNKLKKYRRCYNLIAGHKNDPRLSWNAELETVVGDLDYIASIATCSDHPAFLSNGCPNFDLCHKMWQNTTALGDGGSASEFSSGSGGSIRMRADAKLEEYPTDSKMYEGLEVFEEVNAMDLSNSVKMAASLALTNPVTRAMFQAFNAELKMMWLMSLGNQ